MAKIVVAGAGGWGTALAIMAYNSSHDVSLFSVFPHEAEMLARDRENMDLLKGVKIPSAIHITSDANCVSGADLIILAVPSFAVRDTAALLRPFLKDGIVIANASKGMEEGTFLRMTQVIMEECPEAIAVALSGPSHAEEVARGVPTSVVASSTCDAAAEFVQDMLISPVFRVYVNTDIIGVELGGTLKNIIALAIGVCDGMSMGDNAKAALMTRGLTEIARLGVAMGARAETFAGLTGIGDLVVTCTSMHSRNRRAGILIGEGVHPADAVKLIGMVEGYHATHTAYGLAQKYGVQMPITEQCYQVLFENKDTSQAVLELMDRPKCKEMEPIWLNC